MRGTRLSFLATVVLATVCAHAIPGLTLQTLSGGDTADFFERVAGCRATVVGSSDAKQLAAVAQSKWIMLRTSRGVLELPVLFRDRGDKTPEVRFSITDPSIGGSLRGSLSQTGSGRRCSMSEGCMQIPARLTLNHLAGASGTNLIFDGMVTVIDHCATDERMRVFMTVSWWERVWRLISGH